MKARVISTRYPQVIDAGEPTERRYAHDFGAEIEVSKEEFDRGVEIGALQATGDTAPASHNAKGAAEAGQAILPDGTPATTPEGEPLMAGPATIADEDWTAPRTHAEADAALRDVNLAAPAGAKVADKVKILEDYRAAQAAGVAAAAPATQEHLEDLDDGELTQRAIDFGRVEEELVDKSHDELVLIVAEAMAQQTADPVEQARQVEERAANRED